jgi:hypothetical protein
MSIELGLNGALASYDEISENKFTNVTIAILHHFTGSLNYDTQVNVIMSSGIYR